MFSAHSARRVNGSLSSVDEPWQTLATLLVGLATGVLSGMFGVGGAIISTPAIRALGASPLEGVGTPLTSIFPSAISGTLHYQRKSLVHWRVVGWTGAVGVIAAVLGSLLSDVVPGEGHLLMLATAGLVALTAWRMGRTQRGARPISPLADDAPAAGSLTDSDLDPDTRMPEVPRWKLMVIGTAAGGFSGLLGLGGGIIMVPAFNEWLGLSTKLSIGTSLATVAILAVPGTVTHALLGHIDWSFAIPLSIAVIPGARLGAHLATRSSERALRLSVAIVLGVISVVFAAGELAAWMS